MANCDACGRELYASRKGDNYSTFTDRKRGFVTTLCSDPSGWNNLAPDFTAYCCAQFDRDVEALPQWLGDSEIALVAAAWAQSKARARRIAEWFAKLPKEALRRAYERAGIE